MAQEIVDVGGQGGQQIIRTLFNEKGVRVSLAELLDRTRSETARNLPRFIFVEDGQVTGGSNTNPQIARQPIQRESTKPLPSTIVKPELTVGSGGSDMKLEDWKILNPELAKDLFPEKKEPYSMGKLGSEIVETLEEKIGGPVMEGIRYANENILQKSGGQLIDEFENWKNNEGGAGVTNGDDINPPPVDVPIIQEEGEDPVIKVKEFIDKGLETAQRETPVFVEEILKKVPINEAELKQKLQGGVDENLNLQPDPTQGGDVSSDVGSQAIEIAAREASPVVEQTEVETVSEPPETEEQPLSPVSTKDIKKLADERQIEPATKDAFDEFLAGGYEFFGNAPIIKKIDKEIETNRLRLQKIGSGQIKPYFGKEDTGKKIMAAIAAGLGAYASAMTGTPNFALQIINDAIDRDLVVQKENLERQRLSIIDQNDYLQQQKADLLAYAGLELDRMSTIASTRNDALKDALDIALKEQNLVINTGKIEAQDRKTNEYQFARSVTLADGLSGEFKEDFSVDQIKDKKRQINQFVEGYDVLVGAPDLAGRLAASLRTPLYSESFKEKIWDTNTKQYKDVSKPAKESAKVIDGVVVTDDMVSGAGSIDLTKRGVIEQLKDLATNNKIEIVAGKKLTKAGLKLVQLDTFLRNYYQRYIMITGANLTGTEVLQVNDILPRPGRYTIASGRYLEGLESTRNMLDTLYANRVLRYVKPSPDQRKQPSPKSKLNKEDYTLVGETDG